MERRTFLAAGLGAGAAAITQGQTVAAAPEKQAFKMNYAPHFGMFRAHAGADLLDQLRFMADVGFTAMEDNGMPGRDLALQARIGEEMVRLGLAMGVFVAEANFTELTFARPPAQVKEGLVQKMEAAVEVSKRVNAKWCTVVPGAFDLKMEWDFQTANVVENLKYCAEVCESSGLIMVIEPLNAWRDCPGIFLTKIPQAYMICKAVASPSCKILDDLFHQQIMEGNLIPNIDAAWDEIAYFQIGDNPGRNEPTTGEINYKNVFRHIHQKGYKGIMGMEHGNSTPGVDGEQRVIDAYAACDSF